MKNLSNLSPQPGSNHRKKRKGRGIGSGLGKTAGRGHKGQKARKSPDVGPGFEGGQTPMYKRLPKYGFKSLAPKFQVVNVGSLSVFVPGAKVNAAALRAKGLVKCDFSPVKLLGAVTRGDIPQKLQIQVQALSQGARSALEKAGASIEDLG